MENPKVINPESMLLQQMEGQWQKLLLLVVWKLAPEGVKISGKDIENMINQFAPDGPALASMGSQDGISFKVVSLKEGKRLAEYDATQKGKA